MPPIILSYLSAPARFRAPRVPLSGHPDPLSTARLPGGDGSAVQCRTPRSRRAGQCGWLLVGISRNGCARVSRRTHRRWAVALVFVSWQYRRCLGATPPLPAKPLQTFYYMFNFNLPAARLDLANLVDLAMPCRTLT